MRFRKSEARTHRWARANEECGIAGAAMIVHPLFFLPVGCAFAFAARRFRRNA